MIEKTRMATVIAFALVLCAGCGKKSDEESRLLEESRGHKKAIARLEGELESHRKKLREKEAEVEALTKKLAAVAPSLSASAALRGTRPPVPADRAAASLEGEGGRGGEEAQELPMAIGEDADVEMDSLLEWFARSYAPSVEEGKREQFKRDFDEYVASLRDRSPDEPATERKESVLDGLRDRIAGTTDDEERALLEERVKKIEVAEENDLEGVLDYYQRLDDINGLNELMTEYGISRQELSESGIEPPPRERWGPDVQEISYNLDDFVDRYEPLTETGMREQYRNDFDNFVSELTAEPTEEAVLQRRREMVSDLENRLQSASEGEKRRLERLIQRIESADRESVRRSMQMEKMRELGDLLEKYDIPAGEVRPFGVWLPRTRRRRS